MMRVPPTSARGDCIADRLVELLWCEIAEVVRIELADRRHIANPETAIHDLHGQFAVRGRIAVGNAPHVFEILNQPL